MFSKFIKKAMGRVQLRKLMFVDFIQFVAIMFRPRTFVGLDIGSTTVRVTRFKRGLTGPDEIVCLQQSLLDDSRDETREVFSQQLRELFEKNKLFGVPVVSAIQTHRAFSRILTVPFSDPKKAAQVIPYEMEELIPFGLEEVVIDHTIIGVSEGESTALVVAVPHDRVAEHLVTLNDAGIDPVAIEPDSLSLFHFCRYARMQLMQDVVLIDIGASKSMLCVVRDGKLKVTRSITIAGDLLTRNLLAQTQGTYAEVESAKQDIVAKIEKEDTPASRALHEFLTALTTEIRNTIQSQGEVPDETDTQLYLCGAGAKLKGLEDYLARELNLKVADLPDRRLDFSNKGAGLWDGAYASSLGLAVRPAFWGHDASVNLRRGPFSVPHQERSKKQRSWMKAGVGVGLLVAILFGNFYIDYSAKETHLQELKSTLSKDFRDAFPEITTVVDPVQQAKMALNREQQRLSVLGRNDPAAILFVLADLTAHLPEDRILEINELTVEGEKIAIEASTGSFESVDVIKAAFTQSELLVEVVVSDARMGSRPGQVKFRVTSEVKHE